VGNARSAVALLCGGYGFRCTGYSGPETGRPERVSYVVEQGSIRFVVTAALGPDSPIARHVLAHGDGVHDLAWEVDDAAAAWDSAVRRGASSVAEPRTEEGDGGSVTRAAIAGMGETVHTYVERTAWPSDAYGPGFTSDRLPPPPPGPAVGLEALDHAVGNVPEGELSTWVGFYERVMGFRQLRHFDEHQISTEHSALRSTVVWDGDTIRIPINEPAPGRKRSQIQEYLDAYDGPGVQHLALRTADVVTAVAALRERGIRFMDVPDTYYDDARARMAGVDLPWADLEALRILVDREPDGVLLQIFTEPFGDRPTLFFEIIERRGATGFGEGNFKALFEAIERDQARRGNLEP
jgi:4-hydroxyphenylpyruvate dioxygenase